MQIVPGSRVFSPFRHARLLDQLKTHQPAISGLHANYYHFIDLQQALDELQVSQLQSLLQYGELPPINSVQSNEVWVVPRIGTISPWSSKATEIIQRCGLNAISRVERGICYHIACVDGQTLDLQQEAPLTSLLYDRMTQSLVGKDDLDQVFQHSKPAALVVIPVLTNGLDALLQVNQKLGLGLSQQEI